MFIVFSSIYLIGIVGSLIFFPESRLWLAIFIGLPFSLTLLFDECADIRWSHIYYKDHPSQKPSKGIYADIAWIPLLISITVLAVTVWLIVHSF